MPLNTEDNDGKWRKDIFKSRSCRASALRAKEKDLRSQQLRIERKNSRQFKHLEVRKLRVDVDLGRTGNEATKSDGVIDGSAKKENCNVGKASAPPCNMKANDMKQRLAEFKALKKKLPSSNETVKPAFVVGKYRLSSFSHVPPSNEHKSLRSVNDNVAATRSKLLRLNRCKSQRDHLKGEKFKSTKISEGKVSIKHGDINDSSLSARVSNYSSGLECSSGSDLSTMDASFDRARRNMEHMRSRYSSNVKPFAPDNFVFTFRLPMPDSPIRNKIALILEEILNEMIY